GPGIPEEDRALVFERFHRADAARTMPGSGLGLSIVREVVESHGGTVGAAARDGGGAAIGFSLPVAT
ncbi:MAG: ATP-binding protein, partial [Ilumatobacteraceae bacterium]